MSSQAAKPKIPSIAWVTVAIIWMGYIIVNLTTFSWGMMKADVVSDLGLTEVEFGVLGSSSWILKAILTIPVVLLISRFNAKTLLRSIFIVAAIGIFLQGFAQNFTMIFIGRGLVYGVAAAVLAPLAVMKIKLIPKERMTEVNSLENFTAPAGQVLGTVAILSFITLMGGWRNTLVFMGGLLLLVVVFWSALAKKEHGITTKASGEKVKFLQPLKEALSHKEILLLSFGWPGTGFIWNVVYTHWPAFAQQNFGLTPAQTGVVLGCLPIGSVIGSLLAAKISNALGYDKPLIWPWGFILPFLYGGLMFANSFPVLCIFSFLAGYGAYAFVPLGFTAIYKVKGISPMAVSIGVAMIITMNGLAGAMGSILPPLLGADGGMALVMKVCCLSPVLFGVLTLFLPERGRKYQEREAALSEQAGA